MAGHQVTPHDQFLFHASSQVLPGIERKVRSGKPASSLLATDTELIHSTCKEK